MESSVSNPADNKIKPKNGNCKKCKREGLIVYLYKSVNLCAPCLSNCYDESNVKIYNKEKGWKRRPMTSTNRRVLEKIGRNNPCPCGSGKKSKKCCM